MGATKDILVILAVVSLMVSSTAAWYMGEIETDEHHPYVVHFIDTGFIVTQSSWVYVGNAKLVLTLTLLNNSTTTKSTPIEIIPLDHDGNVIQSGGEDLTQYDYTEDINPGNYFSEEYTFHKSGIRTELNVFQIILSGEGSTVIPGDRLSVVNIEEDIYTSGGGTTLPVKSMIGYVSHTIDRYEYPKYRYYDTAWSDEIQLPTPAHSDVREVRMDFCPISSRNDEAIMVALTYDGYLEAYVYNGFSWSAPTRIAILWTNWQTSKSRPYDIAYEKTSGNAMVLYDNSLNNNGYQELAYKIWDGTSWSQEQYLDDPKDDWPAGIKYRWIKLAADPTPGSNKIGFIGMDSGWWEYSLSMWDGDDWGDWKRVGNVVDYINSESLDLAWEYTSGTCLAVMSRSMRVLYYTWDGSWSSRQSFRMNGDWWNWNWLSLKPHNVEGSDRMMLLGLDTTGTVTAVDWDGTSWNGKGVILDNNMETSDTRCINGDWEPTGTKFLVAGGDRNKNQLSYKTWTPSTGWSHSQNNWATYSSGYDETQGWMQVKTNPKGDDPMITVAWKQNKGAKPPIIVAEWDGSMMKNSVEVTPRSHSDSEGFEVAYSWR